MHTAPENKIPDDEIDLRSIRGKVVSFFAYPFQLLISNIGTTLAFVVAAIVLAFSLKFFIPRTYRSSFIIRPNDKNERLHLKILGDLQSLLSNQEYSTLAQELKMKEGDAEKVAAIEVFNPSVNNIKDSTNYSVVTLEVLDYHLFTSLQNSLLSYLENNPYYFKIRMLQLEQISRELEQVNSDLVKLDSLKRAQLDSYEKQGNVVQSNLLLNDLVNPTAVYGMAIERMNKKTNLAARKLFVDNFQLIKSCIVVKQHAWPPRVLIMCAVLIPCFLLLCILFLHIKRQSVEGRKNI